MDYTIITKSRKWINFKKEDISKVNVEYIGVSRLYEINDINQFLLEAFPGPLTIEFWGESDHRYIIDAHLNNHCLKVVLGDSSLKHR